MLTAVESKTTTMGELQFITTAAKKVDIYEQMFDDVSAEVADIFGLVIAV